MIIRESRGKRGLRRECFWARVRRECAHLCVSLGTLVSLRRRLSLPPREREGFPLSRPRSLARSTVLTESAGVSKQSFAHRMLALCPCSAKAIRREKIRLPRGNLGVQPGVCVWGVYAFARRVYELGTPLERGLALKAGPGDSAIPRRFFVGIRPLLFP